MFFVQETYRFNSMTATFADDTAIICVEKGAAEKAALHLKPAINSVVKSTKKC